MNNKKISKKLILFIKIIDGIILSLIMGLLILYYYLDSDFVTANNLSMSTVSGIVLILAGVLVLSMSFVSARSGMYSNNKGDSMMPIVGFLLIAIGIFTFFIF